MEQTPTIAQPETPSPDVPGTAPSKKNPGEGWRSVFSTVLLLIAAPLIALFLTAFVFQSYEVDGPSMETTLQNQDRLIVLKVGKTWARITHKHFIPKRGEIIVFTKDGLFEFGQDDSKQLIKRVVALPGERVVVRDGKITVYNEQFPDGFSPDSGNDHGSGTDNTPGNVDLIVPEGSVYVCGDNRVNSLDSRSFGPVSSDDIIGRLSLRIFPLDKLGKY